MIRHLLILALAIGLMGVYGATAQETKNKEPEKGPAPTPGKDPTELNPSFDFLLNKAGEIPAINLKAKIIAKNRPPLAIVEILGQEFLVGKNSIIEGAKFVVEFVDIKPEGVEYKVSANKAGPKVLTLR
jgi:hypothetical protein